MNKYLAIMIFFVLFSGCSSVYTTKYFSSRQEYYKNFNDFALDKEVKIRLMDGNLFDSKGAAIVNDTLYSLEHYIKNKFYIFPQSEVSKINYQIMNSNHALIVLKNGTEFNVVNPDISNDSIRFYMDYAVTGKFYIAAISNVKEVRYFSRSDHIGTKILAFTVGGMVTGFDLGLNADGHADKQQQGELALTGCLIGTSTGALLGWIAGWLIGYNYIYVFNP